MRRGAETAGVASVDSLAEWREYAARGPQSAEEAAELWGTTSREVAQMHRDWDDDRTPWPWDYLDAPCDDDLGRTLR